MELLEPAASELLEFAVPELLELEATELELTVSVLLELSSTSIITPSLSPPPESLQLIMATPKRSETINKPNRNTLDIGTPCV